MVDTLAVRERIRTGSESGVLVIDVDPRNGGAETFADYIKTHGDLPETPEVITGGGGRHLYLAFTEAINVKNLGKGVDVQGEGNYVLAPPSLHASGRRYQWELSSHYADVPLGKLPDRWATNGHKTSVTPQVLPELIPKGRREEMLVSLAGTMRRRGADEAAIFAALEASLPRVDQPPGDELTEGDIARIARSASRWPVGATDRAPDVAGPSASTTESASHPASPPQLQVIDGEGGRKKKDEVKRKPSDLKELITFFSEMASNRLPDGMDLFHIPEGAAYAEVRLPDEGRIWPRARPTTR